MIDFIRNPENNDYKSVIYLFFRFDTTVAHAWAEQSESTIEQYNQQFYQHSVTKSENVSGWGSSKYEAWYSARVTAALTAKHKWFGTTADSRVYDTIDNWYWGSDSANTTECSFDVFDTIGKWV